MVTRMDEPDSRASVVVVLRLTIHAHRGCLCWSRVGNVDDVLATSRTESRLVVGPFPAHSGLHDEGCQVYIGDLGVGDHYCTISTISTPI